MSPEQLHAIADKSAENLKRLFEEGANEITQAIADSMEEAQNQSKDKITITFAHQIKLDLIKHAQFDTLTFGVRRKLEIASAMDDPNQMKLDLD